MAILLTKGEAQLTMCIQSHAYTCAHRVNYSHIHTHRALKCIFYKEACLKKRNQAIYIWSWLSSPFFI